MHAFRSFSLSWIGFPFLVERSPLSCALFPPTKAMDDPPRPLSFHPSCSFSSLLHFSSPKKCVRERSHYPRQFHPLIVVQANDALRLTFPIRDMYLEAIDRAEHSIWLTNTHFIPDQNLLDALKAAQARDVGCSGDAILAHHLLQSSRGVLGEPERHHPVLASRYSPVWLSSRVVSMQGLHHRWSVVDSGQCSY
jgi:phosphatidylserine/phosphatidylglycerophosphate/cardiolipin synthase-like enzyme